MTVIAVLFAETFPIVIVDSLISTNAAVRKPIETPLTAAESRPGVDNFYPVGLAKKVVRVGDGIYVLYAGNVKDAKVVLEIIWKYVYGDREYNLEIHKKVCEEIGQDSLAVSFIVLQVVNGADIAHFTSIAKSPAYIAGFGKVIMSGSGASSLCEILSSGEVFQLPPKGMKDQTYIGVAIANASVAMTKASEDYLSAGSEMAKVSAGGFFEMITPFNLFGSHLPVRLRVLEDSAFLTVICEVRSDQVIVSKLLIATSSADATCVISNVDPIAAPEGVDWPIEEERIRVIGIRESRNESGGASLSLDHPLDIRTIAISGFLICEECGLKRRTRNVIPGIIESLGTVTRTDRGLTISEVSQYLLKFATRLREARCERCKERKTGSG